MNLIIYSKSNEVVATITPGDDSQRYTALCGDDYVTLKWESAEHIALDKFAYIIMDGARYTLLDPISVTTEHKRKYKYEARFEGTRALLKAFRFRNPVDKRLKFTLTARPQEHLQMLLDRLAYSGEWSMGECIDAYETTITYDYITCYDALVLMAQTFETEWNVEGGVISLSKVSKDKGNPIALSYGKGCGFVSGVARKNYGNERPISIVYPQGGERNIDLSKYGNSTLLLPKGQSIRYDGLCFEGDLLYDDAQGVEYVADANGTSVVRLDALLQSPKEHEEGVVDCTEIYPHREGRVTDFILRGSPDKEYNYYDIVDDTIPMSLDYEDYRIAGETMVMVFQSGMLAGKEFNVVNYVHTSLNEDYPSRRFELESREYDGVMMPSVDYEPAVGDRYAIFGVALPDAYLRDDATKSGASWDMMRKAVRHLYDNEKPKYVFSGKLDEIYVRNNALAARLIPGAWVSFTDDNFQPEPMLTRIVGVKRNINNPNKVEIDMSEQAYTPTFRTQILASNVKVNNAIVEQSKSAERDILAVKRLATGSGNSTLERKVGILIGDDHDKSVQTIAEEVAAGINTGLPVEKNANNAPLSRFVYPNKVYECTNALIGSAFILQIEGLSADAENVWVIRFAVARESTGDFNVGAVDDYDIKWANGEAPSFEVGKYYELSFRLINTTFLGVWSSFS